MKADFSSEPLTMQPRKSIRAIGLAATLLFAGFLAAPATGAPLTTPFDFSKSEIGVEATIRDGSVYVILDTGVDPSVVDLATADALGLKVDRTDAGEASGFGASKGAAVFPTTIDGLTIRGRSFAPFEALASDMTSLSDHYGRKLDAVLGYSFLSDKIVLIDYPARMLALLDHAREVRPLVQTCRTHWTTPLRTSDSFPVIPLFRFGRTTGPVTLYTGSNGGIGLYQVALDLPGLRSSLIEKGTAIHSGARGDAKTYALAVSVGFGPFNLPAGQIVTVHSEQGATDTRVANIGNALFAAMKIKMLLDYRGRTMTFYGDCH